MLKKRFKMYKKGKQWVTMAVVAFATASLANSLMITSANADDTTTSSTTTSASVSKQADDSENLVEAPAISAVKNGQVTENGATYYYDNGQMKTNYFQSNNGKVYYYGQDGKMYQDKFYSNWGNMYYFGKDGARYTNQYYQNWGNTYYFGEGGVRYTNRFQNVDGKMFYYDQAGVQYRNKFYSNWGNMYYFGADGVRYTNKYYQNWGNTYYFGEGGVRYTNRFQSVDGKMYYYGQDGVQYRNRFYSNWGNMYYFGADGVRYTNKEYDNWGNKYYFGSDGALIKNRQISLNGHNYLANSEGVLNFDYLKPSENKPYPNVNDVNRITVDIRGNRVRLYNGNNLLYTMNCTAGKYVNGRSLTPSGTYAIQAERGGQFMNHTVGMGANYYTSWLNHGEYLFHSAVIDEKGNYIPSEAAKLGKTQGSHGCIRLSVPDAKYMMGMRVGTKVEIFG